MKLTPQIRFLLAVSVQVIILVVLFVAKSVISLTGTEVLLKIQPFDPRDPLRGDYATFQYDISRVPKSYFPFSPPRYGDRVYVPLVRGEKHWTAVSGILSELPRRHENVYLKAYVRDTGAAEYIRLEYGLEQYFIPEGSGQGVNFWNRDAYVKIAVDKLGNGVIKELIVDGKKWP